MQTHQQQKGSCTPHAAHHRATPRTPGRQILYTGAHHHTSSYPGPSHDFSMRFHEAYHTSMDSGQNHIFVDTNSHHFDGALQTLHGRMHATKCHPNQKESRQSELWLKRY